MIDFTPLIEYGITFIVAILGVVGTWALAKIKDKFKIDAESELSYRLDTIVWNAIDFAEQRLHRDGKTYTRETENELIANAANYVVNSAPEILGFFGITPERLAEIIEARLNRKEYDV